MADFDKKTELDSVNVADVRNGGRGATFGDAQEEAVLAQMGYKQELKREWSLMQNFGISFSIISCITGISTLFKFGLVTGGPSVMVYGWIIVSVFTFAIAMAMAEIVSAFPNAGGPYYWASAVSSPKSRPFISWMTGYLNLVGQIAVTTGISYGGASFIATGAAMLSPSFVPTPYNICGIYAAVLFSQAFINIFTIRILKYLNNTSIVMHSLGCFALMIAIVASAPTHQSAKFVFNNFVDMTGDPGWSVRASPAYVACCGILIAQYTVTGFDASAHLSEETHNASRKAPIGVLMSVGCSAVFGFFILLCYLFSIQDLDATINTPTGQPAAQIMIDAVGLRGARALVAIVCICIYLCGTFSITSNSRMMYAFSRDGGLPFSKFWNHTDKEGTPVRTVLLAAVLAFLLQLPALGSAVAFAAATSIATCGLYLSYGIPILVRVINHRRFRRGPFHYGKFSNVIGAVASLWIGFITIVFCLPTANPVTSQTLNYTPVALGIVVAFALGYWLISARKWFVGPDMRFLDVVEK